MRLVLLSNSTNFGGGYLDHAAPAIAEHFKGAGRIAFVPFAIADQAGYHERVRLCLAALELEAVQVMEGAPGRDVLEQAEGIFVGGGNTFRLLDRLQRSDFIALIRSRVLAGVPYLGSSAGTVIAAPTIRPQPGAVPGELPLSRLRPGFAAHGRDARDAPPRIPGGKRHAPGRAARWLVAGGVGGRRRSVLPRSIARAPHGTSVPSRL